jgi:threonyl-tRNA synthetase
MAGSKNIRQIDKIRHSLAHIMAAAVKEFWPEVKLAIGPAVEDGFYYDFDFNKEQISDNALPKIENKMKEIIDQGLEFERYELSVEEALKKEEERGEIYKKELIEELKEEGETKVSYYKLGDFEDLCAGPHVQSTKEIDKEGFKLTKLAGAYWKGDEKNKMLQRIYGIAFENKEALDNYLHLLEEAEKRDHRKLGQELELFMFDDEVGQGLPLWLPKGALLRHLVMTFAFNTYLQRGYEPVSTPHIASLKLWQHSGHLDFYKENLYNPFGIEDEEYMIKPMNCPFHVQMYKFKKKSYRDLPIRWTEMGTVYRYEKSGTLHGLTRVRGFTQDDAHMICTPEQLHDELLEALKLTIYILNSFGFKDFEVNLSVRDPENKEKFIGRDEDWERAEGELKNVLAEAGFKDFVYDVGGAVFYGPKIDVKVKDALGRPWQLSTIQFDFNLPARFNMTYQGADGQEHTPFMIHRALLGSLERFLGVLIEHYGGAFPVWLSPVQIKIISVSEKHIDYCNKLKEEFKEADLRPEVDDKNETVDNKIRKALEEKVPYILVVGDKEMNGDILTVRDRGETKTREIKKEEFLEEVKKKIENKE